VRELVVAIESYRQKFNDLLWDCHLGAEKRVAVAPLVC
jgi:hypothetical protein